MASKKGARRTRTRKSGTVRAANTDRLKKKPKLAFELMFFSAVIAIIVSIYVGYISYSTIPNIAIAEIGFGTVIGVAILASSMNAYSNSKKIVEKWSIVALLLYMIEVPSAWGFGIGFLLCLAGTIIAFRSSG